jgi:outer membrane protein TolC
MRSHRVPRSPACALVLLLVSGNTVAAQHLSGGVPEGAPASGAIDLSLRDAVALGLQRNLGLILSLDAVSEASGSRTVARADLLPQLRAGASIVNQKINLEAFGFSGFPGVPTVIGPFNVFDARAYVTQTILDFDALASSRASERKLEARESDLKSTRDEVVLAVASLYLRVLAAESRIEAAKAQLGTADALRELAMHRKESGLAPGIDVLRAQVQTQSERQRVIVTENDAKKLKLALARAIGLPLGQEYRLTDEMPFAPLPLGSLEDAIAHAYENRADLKASESRVSAAEQEEQAARGEGLPSIGVAGDFGAIGQTVGGSRATYSVSAEVSIPLFEGGRVGGKVAEARSKLHQQQALRDDLKAGIDYEVRAAYGDVEAARERVEVADSALELARQQLDQAKDRFQAGVAGNIDVVQAQEFLARATEDRIESLLSYNSAKAELAGALGTAESAFVSFLRGSNP